MTTAIPCCTLEPIQFQSINQSEKDWSDQSNEYYCETTMVPQFGSKVYVFQYLLLLASDSTRDTTPSLTATD